MANNGSVNNLRLPLGSVGKCLGVSGSGLPSSEHKVSCAPVAAMSEENCHSMSFFFFCDRRSYSLGCFFLSLSSGDSVVRVLGYHSGGCEHHQTATAETLSKALKPLCPRGAIAWLTLRPDLSFLTSWDM